MSLTIDLEKKYGTGDESAIGFNTKPSDIVLQEAL
jgi:hypothetical protein